MYNNNLIGTEKKILEYASIGMDNKQIGEKLSMSHHTVKSLVSKIIKKLGASDLTNAVNIAKKLRII